MSPVSAVLPSIPVKWDRIWVWPPLSEGSTGRNWSGVASMNPDFFFGTPEEGYSPNAPGPADTTALQLANIVTGGAGGTPMARVSGVPCVQVTTTAAGAQQRIGFAPVFSAPLTDTNLAAGSEAPSVQRVFYVRTLWRWDAIGGTPPDDDAGLVMLLDGPRVNTWVTDPANGLGGMGLVGDGAGGLQYRAYAQAPAFPGNVLETVAVPAWTVGEWHLVELQLVTAAPGRDGAWAVWLDGSQVASRGFAGGLLPTYGLTAGGLPTWHFRFARGAAQDMTDALGPTAIYQGRFTRDGVEVPS